MTPAPRCLAVVSLALLALAGFREPAPTLAELVRALGADPAGLAEQAARHHVIGTAILNQRGQLGIAYFEDRGTGAIEPPLHMAYRPPGGEWRHAEVHASGKFQFFGSVNRLMAGEGILLAEMHLTPSASETIAFSPELEVIGRFSGWTLVILPQDLVVFHRSMVHFAPAHPGEVALYDPRTRKTSQLYPASISSEMRRAFVEKIRPMYELAARRGLPSPDGWNPEWFDVVIHRTPDYEPATDTLTLAVAFRAERLPPTFAPPIVWHLLVRCTRMTEPARRCREVTGGR